MSTHSSRIKTIVLLLGIALAGGVTWWFSGLHSPNANDLIDEETAESNDQVASSEAMFVTLTDSKVSAADIETEAVTRSTLTHTHSVPGRVTYNQNRHVEVQAPTSGILTQVLVNPGETVVAGQVLAWLNSPELGSARADVLQRQATANLTKKLAERAELLEKNVKAITSLLSRQRDFEEVREQCRDLLLGDYRRELFGAYARVQLAESMVERTAPLAESGALSRQALQERQAELRTARSSLDAACEQANLDVWTERREADSVAKDSERRVMIARQHLESLLLTTSVPVASSDGTDSSPTEDAVLDLTRLSQVPIRAPIDGTIESRDFSVSERVQTADTLFVLADTTSLWIEAEIRENDWPAVRTENGELLSVTVPALNDAQLTATVEYIGREVRSGTNAVPIVAQFCNSNRQLRPGLFVRVSVPVEEKQDVLTVPVQSVLSHEGQSFVFVAVGNRDFRRVDVLTGDEGRGRIEVVSGLSEADSVVTAGAFLLKSELLLESEEE